MVQQNKKFLSPKQAAETVGATTTSVMKLIKSKSIKAEKLGWVWMISTTELPKLEELTKTKKN